MGACTQKLSGGISLPYFSDEEVDCRISQPSGFCRCFFGIPMCLQVASVLFVRMSAITSKNLMEPPRPPYLAWFGT